MTHKITISALHNEPIDLDKLAGALLGIVSDLDEKTQARMAKKGKRLYEQMLRKEGQGKKKEASAP